MRSVTGEGAFTFSGRGVSDRGRVLDIQFLVVEGSLTGQGTGHSVFSGRGVSDGGRALDIHFSVVEGSLTGAGHWTFSF